MPDIKSCIDHIKTAVDVDPWAADMAEKALKVMERREKTMRINEYQTLAARTINKNLTDVEMILHALHGLSAEVGELHGIYQKSYQGHEVNPDDVKKEVGDIMWMVAEFCTAKGWELEDICQMNIDKLRRRYPQGFSEERSVHRTE